MDALGKMRAVCVALYSTLATEQKSVSFSY